MTKKPQPREEDDDDEDDSSFGASSKGGADSGSSEHISNSSSSNDAENQYFGQSENRKVKSLKNLVFLVLFLVTLAVCLVIYFLTRKGQEDEFEASYVRSPDESCMISPPAPLILFIALCQLSGICGHDCSVIRRYLGGEDCCRCRIRCHNDSHCRSKQ